MATLETDLRTAPDPDVESHADRARRNVDECLRKVAAYDDPAVWIHRLPPAEVVPQVERAIERMLAGVPQPLLGVTVAVKDNIDLAGVPTTAGCPLFAYTPAASATVVLRLIDAGAVVIGKTNLDQFATGLVGTRSPYGTCRNVFDKRYVPGGSSSGSAVAVAAGLVDVALGTDTAGSGRVPAAFGNIVGLKPTGGLVSAAGVVPACRSLDCVSIFARTVAGAHLALEAAQGFDAADAYSRHAPPAPRIDAKAFRFGVPADDDLEFFGNAEAGRIYRSAADRASRMGGTPVPIDFAPFREAGRLLYEGPWVAERLAAVKELFRANPQAFLPLTRAIIGGADRFSAVDAFEAQYKLRELARLAEAEWAKMDVLFLPTTGTIYTIAEVEADPIRLNQNLGYYTNFTNLLDLCALAVPAGLQSDGLPAGVTFMAPAGRDDGLAALGSRFELAG